MSEQVVHLNGSETYYLILRDEHGNTVRVPSHAAPEWHYSRGGSSRLTGLLLQCEGLTVERSDGTTESVTVPMEAWLESCTEHDAQSRMDFELRHRLRR